MYRRYVLVATFESSCNCGSLLQIEESRARVSEKSSEMHNTVVEAHEKSKNLEKELKALNKELQSLLKEKEAAERQKTEALSFYAKKELDVRDVEERMRAEARTQVNFKHFKYAMFIDQ